MSNWLPALATTSAFVALAFSVPAMAEDDAAGSADSDEPKTHAAPAKSAAPTSEQESRPPARLPQDATAALARAAAAYDYGDMNQVVEAARPVTEGLLQASPEKQAYAFRLLGIGLYLTNRPAGAETAFTELLRRDPKARLDPTTTRPEVVAFFENLRRKYLVHQRSERRVIWNFIPPVGQFQNEDNARGWFLLGVGVAALATATTTDILLHRWQQPGHTYGGHKSVAGPLKTANWIAVGVLAAVYIYGVFDGLVGYSKPLEDSHTTTSLRLRPMRDGLGFTF